MKKKFLKSNDNGSATFQNLLDMMKTVLIGMIIDVNA